MECVIVSGNYEKKQLNTISLDLQRFGIYLGWNDVKKYGTAEQISVFSRNIYKLVIEYYQQVLKMRHLGGVPPCKHWVMTLICIPQDLLKVFITSVTLASGW